MKQAAARIKKIVPGNKGKIRPRIPIVVNPIPNTKKVSRLPSRKFFMTDFAVSKFVVTSNVLGLYQFFFHGLLSIVARRF